MFVQARGTSVHALVGSPPAALAELAEIIPLQATAVGAGSCC